MGTQRDMHTVGFIVIPFMEHIVTERSLKREVDFEAGTRYLCVWRLSYM